jgi:hypothetical protein
MARKVTKKATAKKTPKRPRDPNQFAHALIRDMTDRLEATQREPPAQAVSSSEISRVMAEMGRRGGKIGGKKRAEGMTRERRVEIALKAARSRWDNRLKD